MTTPTTHTLIKDNQTTGIAIQGWTVLSHKTSILNSQEIDAYVPTLFCAFFDTAFLSTNPKGPFFATDLNADI